MLSQSDRQWFIEELKQEHVGLRNYVRGLGVRADLVDDVAQDAVIVAMKRLDAFDRNRNFGAWLRGIAKRVVLNARRSEDRRRYLLSAHATDVLMNLGQDEDPVSDQRHESLAALRQCIAALPDRSRQLIHDRYYAEESTKEIAERLQQSPEQVAVTLFRIRKKMSSCVRLRMQESMA